MADDEIQILITAVDNTSKQIEQVQKTLSGMADETTNQTQKIS